MTKIDGNPGFSGEVFVFLQHLVQQEAQRGRGVLCSLVLDEMAIHRSIEFDGKKFVGYLDLGGEIGETEEYATNALVFLVVSQLQGWKLPISYYLINSLNGEEKANLVTLNINKLLEVGVEVVCVVCDGARSNLTMYKHLGGKLEATEIINPELTLELNPLASKPIYGMLDVVHMMKLIRNSWATLGKFKFIFKLTNHESRFFHQPQ